MRLHWMWVAFVAILLLPVTACAKDPTQPIENTNIIGFAYGHMLTGDPVFTLTGDTLFVSGTVKGSSQPYYPRREAAEPAIADNSNPEFDAVLDEAHAAASSMTDSWSWTQAFTTSLNAHLGQEIMSIDPREDAIRVQFANGREISVMVPCGAPETPRTFKLADEIARQRAQFADYVSRKVWVVWGVNYTILVPPQRHSDMLVAMEKITSGLSITAAERENTPFKDENFEADFRQHMEEVR